MDIFNNIHVMTKLWICADLHHMGITNALIRFAFKSICCVCTHVILHSGVMCEKHWGGSATLLQIFSQPA